MGNSTLERIERFELKALAGANYSISLLRPVGHFAAGSVPILFVTDADMLFGIAAEIYGAQQGLGAVRPAILVGIGYGASPAEMAKLRTADLTPPSDAGNNGIVDQLAAIVGSERGRADAFLDFILGDLTHAIIAHAPEAAGTGNMLFGHSLGGLFTVHALFTRPEAFSGFYISSPSLWWNEFAILNEVGRFRDGLAKLTDKPQIFIAVGGQEQDIPQSLPESLAAVMTLEAVQDIVRTSRMVDAACELGALGRDAGITRSLVRVYDGEDHGSVVASAISRTIFFAFKPS